ncbi:MAG: MmcQ/YjbR family DNA-binding protein [Chitinophagaceae bacterium]|nr:MAG: MmcQ/YjbR family DNA-binding protein [Chitinophagaceae bacterium]
MAEKACHVFTSTVRFGLTQALARDETNLMKADQLRKYALSLPETTEEPHFNFASFRVKGKIFVTLPPEERHAHIFVDDEHREMATTLHPEYVEPLMWGKKIAGVRVALSKATPTVVTELVRNAWVRKASRSLVKAAG